MISFESVTVQFSGEELFSGISLMIRKKDRIGLVGKNGAGKTTMLRLLTGEMVPDEGALHFPKDISIGYLPQHLDVEDTKSVYDEAAEAFAEINRLQQRIDAINQEITRRTDYHSQEYNNLITKLSNATERIALLDEGTIEQKIEQTLLGLGFLRSDLHRPTGEFSGGWRMRIELAKILLEQPDLLLLDEPINHLDIQSIQWFEDFLKNYHGTAILIAHDRDFLDNVTNRTIELSLGKAYDYDLPYSRYREKRKEEIALQQAAKKNQEKKIEDTQKFIDRFRYQANKASQVQSRIKQLDKMNRIEVEDEDNTALSIRFPAAIRSGKIVAEMENMHKSYGDVRVLEGVNLIIERGEKAAFVGRNGEGKSTLIKVMTGEVEYSGKCKLGHNVKIGYFAQDQAQRLDPEKTVYQTLDDVATGDVRTQVRDILGGFLFSGEDVDKKVQVLSGGERTRLALAKLLLERYSLLILDEPTNHLDIRSKEILKQAINQYDGTVIMVSHDRNFLNGLATRIYEFKNRDVKEHTGTIYELLNKHKLEELNTNLRTEAVNKQAGKNTKVEKVDSKAKYEERKALDKTIRKVQNQLKNVEREISELEAEMETLKQKLAGGNVKRDDVYQRYDEVEKLLDEKMNTWERLTIDLDKYKEGRQELL